MGNDNITLYNGDCLDVMQTLYENGYAGKIDACITDPPYNISRKNNFDTIKGANRVGMDFGEWDKEFDLTGWINPMSKLLKPNANVVIFNDWKNLGIITEVCVENHIIVKRCLVLNKSNPAPFNRDRMFVNNVEFAVWGVYNPKDKPTAWTFNREDSLEKCVFDSTVQSSKLHPTMKDIKVISKLVRLLTNEGDTVLDCFMGSGTTGVACNELNRNFVGIEISKEYYDTAKDRICEYGV